MAAFLHGRDSWLIKKDNNNPSGTLEPFSLNTCSWNIVLGMMVNMEVIIGWKGLGQRIALVPYPILNIKERPCLLMSLGIISLKSALRNGSELFRHEKFASRG
jgi:hypothetical protein